MRALLDTNILLAYAPIPEEYDELRVASLTWGEVRRGIGIARGAGQNTIAIQREREFGAWQGLYGPGLAFDDDCAATFELLVELTHAAGRESRGRVIDLMIAATAVANDAALITSNVADFRGLDSLLTVVEA